MKKIKINFYGFWDGFNKTENLLIDILKERYEIEISDHPDFLIASPFEKPFSYMDRDCVRILYTGEPLAPDFNVFDYAIGFDNIVLPDSEGENRYYRYPFCFYYIEQIKQHSRGLTEQEAREALREKRYFCNFIYGHPSAKGEREAIFDALQKYKRVESAGSFMNNMPEGKIVPFTKEKLEFLQKCKFTIACESIRYPGFVTEKVVDPFCAHSVPIYYGNPTVDLEFNPEAMINLNRYSTLEEGIERVIQVDQNDELYLKMLMAPKLISDDYLDRLYEGLKKFLFHIFDQDREAAYRRLRFYVQKHHEDCLREYSQLYNSPEYRAFQYRRRLIRRIQRTFK